MKRFLMACGMLLSSQAMAAENWTTTDTVLLGGALATLAADWSQTRVIVGFPGLYYETNPVMGSHPSSGAVNRYFLAAVAGTAGLAYVLPVTYRRAFLGGIIVLESAVIVHNNKLGLQVRF
ncbi:MAG TPA: hypothetical protein VIV54_19295 [Burkholderiales bacterium]